MRILVEAANGAVGVENGYLVPVSGNFDIAINVTDGELRPGLINAHEHLHRNHYGRLGTPPYKNAYDWGDDIHVRHADAIAHGRLFPRDKALLRGAEKNLRSGVTTVVHHDSWEPQFDLQFPLRVLRVRHAHALGTTKQIDAIAGEMFMIHLAEGTDAASSEEVHELGRRGLVSKHLLAVHVVGADANGVRNLRAAGAAVVWCPTSNLFLFGRTAPADLLAPGIDVLLGSDSLLSGAGTLLDEMWVARELGLLSDERLLGSVGALAAKRLGIAAPSLEIGARADLAIFRKPLLEASVADVALVIADGRIRVLDPSFAAALGDWSARGAIAEMDGVARWICLSG